MITFENLQQGDGKCDDYTTGCLLNYQHFKTIIS